VIRSLLLSKYKNRKKELANNSVISRKSGKDMQKKTAYIGNAKNKTILFRYVLQSGIFDICRCQSTKIINTNPKLKIGSALISKYLLSEKLRIRACAQVASGGWSK
jgi:hypothetical protein